MTSVPLGIQVWPPSMTGVPVHVLSTWLSRNLGWPTGTRIQIGDGPVLALARTYFAEVELDSFAASTTYRLTINGTDHDVVSPASEAALFDSLESEVDGISGFNSLEDDGSLLFIWSNEPFTASVSIVSGAGTWIGVTESSIQEFVPLNLYERGVTWERELDVTVTPANSGPSLDGSWGKEEIGTGTVTSDGARLRILCSGVGNRASIVRYNSGGGIKTSDESQLMFVECQVTSSNYGQVYALAMAGIAATGGWPQGSIALNIDTNGHLHVDDGSNFDAGSIMDASTRIPVWGMMQYGATDTAPAGSVIWGEDGSAKGGGAMGSSIGGLGGAEEQIGALNTNDDVDMLVFKVLSGKVAL